MKLKDLYESSADNYEIVITIGVSRWAMFAVVNQLKDIGSKKLRQYMLNYLAIMMTVSSILCIRSKNKENLEKKKELWQYLKKKDMRSFIRIRYGILGQTMNIPGKSGRKISSLVYIVARRLIGFN